MRYLKLASYKYQDHPNEQALCIGFDESGLFVHQIIEDTSVDFSTPLYDSVLETNQETIEFAKQNGFEITYGLPQVVHISGTDVIYCRQDMSFDDGRHAVQMNAYFYDPDDHVYRMVQFGTVSVQQTDWEDAGDELVEYCEKTIKQLINKMFLPETIATPLIKRFVRKNKQH